MVSLDPTCVFLPPKSITPPERISNLVGALKTRFGVSLGVVRKNLDEHATIEEWGKIKRVDSSAGDTMHASGLGIACEDSRDASWVRVRGFCLGL